MFSFFIAKQFTLTSGSWSNLKTFYTEYSIFKTLCHSLSPLWRTPLRRIPLWRTPLEKTPLEKTPTSYFLPVSFVINRMCKIFNYHTDWIKRLIWSLIQKITLSITFSFFFALVPYKNWFTFTFFCYCSVKIIVQFFFSYHITQLHPLSLVTIFVPQFSL